MKFTKKPKTIEAVQFIGHESIGEIMRLCTPRGIQYVEELGVRTLFIEMPEEQPVKVKSGEYVILQSGNFKQRRVVIVSKDEFDAKYEQVPFSASVKLNEARFISGFGIGIADTAKATGGAA